MPDEGGVLPSRSPKGLPGVGIVVLNYRNCEKTIRCIESITQLDYPNKELVIVDNASLDGSASRIRAVFPWACVLESPTNVGYAGGNAIGYQYFLSRPVEYLWILNNDTRVDSAALGHMVGEFEKDPGLGAVGSMIVDERAGGAVLAAGGGQVDFWLGRVRHVRDLDDGRGLDYVSGASMLVPMKVLERVGFIDDAYFLYYEDADFCFTLRDKGLRLATARQAVVYHDESSSIGRKSLAQCYYMNRSFVRFMVRHSPVYPVSLAVGASTGILKRLLLGRFREAAIMFPALRDGWRERKRKSSAVSMTGWRDWTPGP